MARLRTVWLGLPLALCGCGSPDGTHGDDASSTESGGDGTDWGDGDTGAVDLPGVCGDGVRVERPPVYVAGPDPAPDQLDACDEHLRFVAAAQGVELRVDLAKPTPAIEWALTWPDDIRWEAALVSGTAESPLTFEVPRSGEFALLMRHVDPAPVEDAAYSLEFECAGSCNQESTRFPIVLVHGWTGFEDIGPIDYFFNVPPTLTARGYPVHVAVLDPYNSVEVRSGQLADVADEVLISHRARKVDIIAHSQGGLDARMMISTLDYGDRVSALYTISTPHYGTPLTDVALGLAPGDSELALFFLLELVGAAAGQRSDARASFESLSETYVQGTFNPANPNNADVEYASWAGRTCLLGLSCDDTVDAPILAGYEILTLIAGDNDGIVPMSSAMWGDYRGEMAADHFDEVGQVAGLTSPNFDHEAFYLERARELRQSAH